MKKILIIIAAVFSFGVAVCAQNTKTEKNMNAKAIVVYFSATGTTKNVAEKIAKAAKADIMEIEPEQPYTSADLDWRNKQSRSSIEMHDLKYRPAIKDAAKDVADYDVIFIGFPIWWDLAPTAVNTFIEKYDLKGKTVIPFATSGGSTIRNSAAQLKKLYPEINWKEGKLLNSPSTTAIENWLKVEF